MRAWEALREAASLRFARPPIVDHEHGGVEAVERGACGVELIAEHQDLRT